MEQLLRGKALVLGNNIDTDQIYPGRFLELTDHKQIGSHCFAGIDEAIAPGFPKGGIVVAGRNFGCGSSREHAPIALLNMGAAAVVADSFARIFYRNSFNMGLLLLEVGDDVDKIHDGDELDIDAAAGVIHNRSTGEDIPFPPLPSSMAQILNKGGLVPYVRERMQSA